MSRKGFFCTTISDKAEADKDQVMREAVGAMATNTGVQHCTQVVSGTSGGTSLFLNT